VDTWRIIATSLLALSGIVMTLVFAAQARDRRGSSHKDVIRVVLISLVVFAVLCVLTATVLPDTIVWGLVVAIAVVIVLLHQVS
jgi:cell division protein FtsW (lipid II flippase)